MKLHNRIPIAQNSLWRSLRSALMPLFGIALFVSLLNNVSAAVIYRQNFGYTGASPTSFSSVDWDIVAANGGGNVGPVSGANAYYAGIRSTQGKPIDQPNVNAPVSASDQFGVGQINYLDGISYTVLLSTDSFSIDRSQFDVETFSWYAASSIGSGMRAAVKIDTAWYVTDLISTPVLSGNNPANFTLSAGLRTVDIDAVNWFSLTADIGAPFSIGGVAQALPTGNISAFGMYVPSASQGRVMMVDSFSINASPIPEPGTTGILISAMAFFVITFASKRCRLKRQ